MRRRYGGPHSGGQAMWPAAAQAGPPLLHHIVHPEPAAVSVTLALSLALLAAQPAAAPPSPSASAAADASPWLFPGSAHVVRDRISVEVVGQGPDLVLIPGLASSRETWRRTAERLRGRYRVHLVQLAGFAGEPARGDVSTGVMEPATADIDAYLASLPRPPIVMGHSLGGTIGLALAERHPEHMSRLLIVDSLPFYGVLAGGPNATAESVRPIAEGFRGQMRGAMPEPMARAMMSQMVTAPADVDRVVSWTLASDPRAVGGAMVEDMTLDLRPGLAAVRTPVTVLYETQIKAMIETGYATLGPKTLVEVPGAKHFIMYDQPDAFDAQVDAFLKR